MIPDESKSIVQEVSDPILSEKNIKLLLKRDDLIHPEISGNKWRKLKYNLHAAKQAGHHTLLSFGGAFSNHILALAYAGKEFGFKTIGVIRGEEEYRNNPTLSLAVRSGMQLHFVSREQYRKKNDESFIQELLSKFGKIFILPEGGTNCKAIQGCQEIAESITDHCDYLCSSIGTGGTLAGLITSLKPSKKVLGFAALKGDFLRKEIERHLFRCELQATTEWEVINKYHFGGYAKFDDSLIGFINKFYRDHQIPLDPIYTGKMLFGVFDLIQQDYFEEGSSLMVLHSGGLQGIRGFNILHHQAIIIE